MNGILLSWCKLLKLLCGISKVELSECNNIIFHFALKTFTDTDCNFNRHTLDCIVSSTGLMIMTLISFRENFHLTPSIFIIENFIKLLYIELYIRNFTCNLNAQFTRWMIYGLTILNLLAGSLELACKHNPQRIEYRILYIFPFLFWQPLYVEKLIHHTTMKWEVSFCMDSKLNEVISGKYHFGGGRELHEYITTNAKTVDSEGDFLIYNSELLNHNQMLGYTWNCLYLCFSAFHLIDFTWIPKFVCICDFSVISNSHLAYLSKLVMKVINYIGMTQAQLFKYIGIFCTIYKHYTFWLLSF